MTELRVDPLTGARVAVVGSRQGRPNRPPAEGCPFCVGGTEAPEPYEVKAFTNRWPTFPDARCEVVLYTPDHDATFTDLGVPGARRVVDLWAERTVALGGRPDVDYVLVFENRGGDVGATIPHPHGQIFAYDHVPELPRRELDRAAEHGCPLCGGEPAERYVARHGTWTAEVPLASGYPFGLLVRPHAHVPDLPALADAERDDLAGLLIDVLGRLDRLFDAPMPYMLWFHQRPTDGGDWPQAHLHLEVAPILRAPGVQRYVAGAELGAGMLINPIAPEDAAARLRDA